MSYYSNPVDNIHEIELKIKAVEYALGSFADYDNEQERKKNLRENLTAIPGLKTFFSFSEVELKDALLLLLKDKLQEKENLSRAQQKSGIFIYLFMSFSTYIFCFLFVIFNSFGLLLLVDWCSNWMHLACAQCVCGISVNMIMEPHDNDISVWFHLWKFHH